MPVCRGEREIFDLPLQELYRSTSKELKNQLGCWLNCCFARPFSLTWRTMLNKTTDYNWKFCWTNFSCSFQNGGCSRRLQGEKTFCASPAQASDHSLSQAQAFLLTVFVCHWSSEWTTRDANVSGLLFVKYFCVTLLLFLRHLKITLDSEQPMLKKKQIIPSVWGGIKSFEHFQRGEYFFSDSAFD